MRSVPNKSHRIPRRAAWPPFISHQIALSTTAFCCGLPGAVYSAADPSGVGVVDVAPAGELLTVLRAEAVRLPHAVHVGDEPMQVRDGLSVPLHPVMPHLPRGAVGVNYQVKAPAHGHLVGASQVDVHRLHRPSRARYCLSRPPSPHTLRLQAPTARLQHSRQGGTVLPSRFSQQTFVYVAGGGVKVVNIKNFWQASRR